MTKAEGRSKKAEGSSWYRALVRLEQRGGGFIEPGEVRELEPERAKILLELRLIEPAEGEKDGEVRTSPFSSSAEPDS